MFCVFFYLNLFFGGAIHFHFALLIIEQVHFMICYLLLFHGPQSMNGDEEGKRRKQIAGKKKDCPAQIYYRDILKFPDYAVSRL